MKNAWDLFEKKSNSLWCFIFTLIINFLQRTLNIRWWRLRFQDCLLSLHYFIHHLSEFIFSHQQKVLNLSRREDTFRKILDKERDKSMNLHCIVRAWWLSDFLVRWVHSHKNLLNLHFCDEWEINSHINSFRMSECVIEFLWVIDCHDKYSVFMWCDIINSIKKLREWNFINLLLIHICSAFIINCCHNVFSSTLLSSVDILQKNNTSIRQITEQVSQIFFWQCSIKKWDVVNIKIK